jgi:polyhydroxyalkanoate synthesis regulator phasin
MVFLIIGATALAILGYYAWKVNQPAPLVKIKETAKITATVAKEVAKDIVDVNNDGKVNLQDAAQVVKNVKAEVKRAKRKYGGKVKKKASEE